MSNRIFLGLKDSTTPVIKVMADAADNPRTTPNDAWTKFRFNSEVDQLPYAKLIKSYEATFHARGDYQYFPDGTDYSSDFELFMIITNTSPNGLLQISGRYWNIFPNYNKFLFMRVSVAGQFDYLIQQQHGNYPGGDWGQIVVINQPIYMFLPSLLADGTTWDLYLGQETYFSNIYPGDGSTLLLFQSDHVFTNTELAPGLTFKVAFYEVDMPVDDSDYPAVVGTPAPGKKILKLNTTTARMAKPGYDVETASEDQMLFTETKVPLAIIKTGVVTLTAGAQTNVELGQTIDPAALVDYQIGVPGETLYLPPYRGFKQLTQVRHRISGTQLQFMNDSDGDLEARYYVMAKDSLGDTSGSAKVLERINGGQDIIIRKPGTAGTNTGDIIYDSRWAYMPIVAQDWVPYASFVNDTLGGLARKRYSVALDNDGSWKPYVMARLARKVKAGTLADVTVFKDFMTRQMGFASHHGADSNFIAAVTDDQVDFYCGNGSDYEAAYYAASGGIQNAYLDTIGLRYYIFAVPSSL